MRSLRPVFLAVLTAAAFSLNGEAVAQVASTGDVLPADDPRTAAVFGLGAQEGLPIAGNLPDFLFGIDADGNLADANGIFLGQPNYERNLNVIIGRNAPGEVNISAGAALRYGHLVLGGDESTDVAATGDLVNAIPTVGALQERTNGTGTLRITGFGSVYNNHPNIVPATFQDDPSTPAGAETTFFDIPATDFAFADGSGTFLGTSIQRNPETGFDAYVGLTGNGVLEITAGGRAEIQDAFIVGYGTQASGFVRVSDVGSSLVNYGGANPFTDPSVTASPISQMIIGAYGSGTLRIENSATVQALRGAAIGVTQSDGQHIDAVDTDDLDGNNRGNGTVVVTGAGSTWEITLAAFTGGPPAGVGDIDESALAIGEFVAEENEITLEPVYEPSVGRGSLRIEDGGTVRLLEGGGGGLGAGSNDRDDADLRIGRFGELSLADGSLEVRGDIFSDGQIEGDGEIETGTFVNRARGVVSVGAGESLTIRSNADEPSPNIGDLTMDEDADDILLRGAFDAATPAGVPPLPLIAQPTGAFGINVGSIQVIGDENGIAEFTYERADDEAPMAGSTVEQRFWNARRTAPAGGPPALNQAGEIIVNNGHLNFRTGADLTGFNDGIRNDGEIAFVGGNNLVTGGVEITNLGRINVTNAGAVTSGGDGTFVTFADGAINNGVMVVDGADVQVLPGSDAYSGSGTLALFGDATFTAQGTFRTEAGAELSFTPVNGDTPNIIVNGDFLIAGATTIGIDSSFTRPISAGDVMTLISVTGNSDLTNAGIFNTLTFVLPAFDDPDLVPFLDISSGSLVLEVLSLSDPTFNPINAADFNGDGVLDDLDLDIFAMFFGVQENASIFTGDIDGDGAVTAADFFLLQDLFPPASLASVSASIAVPEPSSVGLMLLCCVGAAARRRR